jgi:predicted negative regulator of RcsB-dependent stress response
MAPILFLPWVILALSPAMADQECRPSQVGIQLKISHKAIQGERWDMALDCLNGSPAPEWAGHVAALRGLSLLGTTRVPDAVVSLQTALDDPNLLPPLRDVVRFRLGQGLSKIEDQTGALKMLTDLLAQGMQGPGKLPAPGSVDPAEIRSEIADIQVAQGKIKAAVRTLETLWTHNPTSPFAEGVEARLTALQVSINTESNAGQLLVLRRIKTLEKLYRTRAALALREQLPPGHPSLEPHALAAAVFKAKDYARATALLTVLRNRSQDEGILLALAQVRSGQAGASIKTYRQLAQGSGPVAELAAYKLGYMAFDQRDWSTSVGVLARYLREFPRGLHTESALWFSAMAHLRLGELGAANKRLKRLELDHPRSSLRPGSVYWQALTGPKTDRKARLESVIKRWPQTGYAWFASQALGITYPLKPEMSSEGILPALDGPHWRIGSELSSAGLDAWARPHLEILSKNTKNLSKRQKIGLANALIGAGSYRSAKRMVRHWCGAPGTASSPSLIAACWPKPNAAHIQSMAANAGLPPYLPFAIMTAESALDPAVTSPAGARGLMQLMPSLALDLHQQLWPDQPFNPDHMYAPDYNAILGTTELIHLAEQFAEVGVENPLPLVIAGYNGGADAVARWVEHYQGQNQTPLSDWSQRPVPDVWAEFIGYGETRKYVRRVLGYLQTYRLAYGDQAPQASSSSATGTSAKGSQGAE